MPITTSLGHFIIFFFRPDILVVSRKQIKANAIFNLFWCTRNYPPNEYSYGPSQLSIILVENDCSLRTSDFCQRTRGLVRANNIHIVEIKWCLFFSSPSSIIQNNRKQRADHLRSRKKWWNECNLKIFFFSSWPRVSSRFIEKKTRISNGLK